MCPSCSKLLKGGQKNLGEGERRLLRRLLPSCHNPNLASLQVVVSSWSRSFAL